MAEKITYPHDRFDDVPRRPRGARRIGAHRVIAKPRYFWQWLTTVLVLTVLLTAGGIFYLTVLGNPANNLAAIAEQSEKDQAEKAAAAKKAEEEAEKAAAEKAAADKKAAEEAAQQQAAEQTINPNATVSVLNAAGVSGLAASVGNTIGANNYGVVQLVTNAPERSATSKVVYVDQADSEAAQALASELGTEAVFDAVNYAAYNSQLVVVLGADYSGPGAL